jgi:hypothetical protein
MATAIAAVAAPTGRHAIRGEFRSERLCRDLPAISQATAIAAVAAPTGRHAIRGEFRSERLCRDRPATSQANAIAAVAAPTKAPKTPLEKPAFRLFSTAP